MKVAVIGGTDCIERNFELVSTDDEFDVLIISYMSCTLLAKSALGLDDVITRTLLKEKPIYVLKSGLEYKKAKNNNLYSLYRSYETKLSSFGVKFVDIIPSANKDIIKNKVITIKDIEKCEKSEILVSKGTIITPLAVDEAVAKNIKIIRVEENGNRNS